VTYDMAYGPQATVFQQWGERQGGSKNLAGLGMLVNQAAFSFAAWRGVMPQVQPVCQRLLEKIRESQ
jgi:shikimate dehydrogenase